MKPDSPSFPHYLNILSQFPIFKNLDKERLTEILSSFNRVTWTKKSPAMDSDQTIQRFYVIISGRMKISRIDPDTGRELTIFLLTPGDIFDVICLLDEHKHYVYATAIDDVEALYVSIEKVRGWIRKYPEFNQTFLPYLAEQMRSLEELATELTFHDTFTRLSMLLLRHAGHGDSSKKLKLINDLSHEELANMVGSVRVVISRHMGRLEKDGIIHTHRKWIELKDLNALLEQTEKRIGIQ